MKSLTKDKDKDEDKDKDKDKDKDEREDNCVKERKGAWWCKRCFDSSLNDVYYIRTLKHFQLHLLATE